MSTVARTKYVAEGTAHGGEKWTCEGTVDVGFPLCFEAAMRQNFEMLTGGKAVFGQPGVGGCRGPYKITRFELTVVPCVVTLRMDLDKLLRIACLLDHHRTTCADNAESGSEGNSPARTRWSAQAGECQELRTTLLKGIARSKTT
jgi:hypothetical protein